MSRVLLRPSNQRLLDRAIEAGFDTFFLDGDALKADHVTCYRLRDGSIHANGRIVGKYVAIKSANDEQRVRKLRGKHDIVAVELANWKVIPLENLVAALGKQTKLFAVARDAKQAKLFLETLEVGVDGVILQPKTLKDVASYASLFQSEKPSVSLVEARITKVEPVGVGERVCVDTVNVFSPGEGLLVGSTSSGFFLVSAECFETEYVRARPFRVNAGAVHSYVWNGATTNYLSELASGSKLEAVDHKGRRRDVVVGRAKIETRPLLLVEAQAEKTKASILLQNAETIRLVQPRGRVKSVSQLKVGDKVLVHAESGARHFGMKIEERIEER